MNCIYSLEKITLHTYHQKDDGTWTIFLISKHGKRLPSLLLTFGGNTTASWAKKKNQFESLVEQEVKLLES